MSHLCVELEYPLSNHDLQSDTEALWVEGIGYIAQYHCYCDMLYSHGIIYLLRDWLLRDLEKSICKDEILAKLAVLNSKIQVLESQCLSLNTPLRPTELLNLKSQQ
jgi:hypothetical protein